MATKKFTREELTQMLADMDSETDDDEELIVEENGRRFHMRGKRATSLLDKLFEGYGFGDDSKSTDDKSTDDNGKTEDDDEPQDDASPKSSVWGRK